MSAYPPPPESWTEDEARAYLPRLKVLVAIVRRTVQLTARARGNGHSKTLEEVVEEQAGDHGADSVYEMSAKDALDELAGRGIILRDLERGLVDFPSRSSNGRAVLLCWQAGEDDLGWWHLPEDGFAGRRPLPLPPEL